jgi:uncharacterized membrane protein
MTTAYLLVLGAELFYIRDVFGSRLNTVFKLYYQAWLLLAVGGAFSLYWLLREEAPLSAAAPAEPSTEATDAWAAPHAGLGKGVWAGVTGLILLGALLYPLGATLSRTDGLSRAGRTLDGLAYARRDATDDIAAANWLRDRAGLTEVVVEATGNQYTQASRVAAWTGIPSVLGWAGHEVQWGRDGEELRQRQIDIDQAYTTESLAEALAILQKYDVTYVFVGGLERGKYPAAGLQKFEAGLTAVHRTGLSAVYRVPLPAAPSVTRE